MLPDATDRLPSWTPSFEGHKKRVVYNHPEDVERGSPGSDGSSSPHGHAESSEEASGSNSKLHVTVQLNMKTLMSILPAAAWWNVDFADVQWNPHPSRAEYIHAVYLEVPPPLLSLWRRTLKHPARPPRAITDIIWHPAPAERDLVVSTGVDSWIWAWDLCARGGRAVFASPRLVDARKSSGTARTRTFSRQAMRGRNGSLPTMRLRAHRSKVYGIDWSPALRDEIVWDVGTEADGASLYSTTFASTRIGPTDAWLCDRARAPRTWRQETLMREHTQRKRTIRTALPRRGEMGLEMWGEGAVGTPTAGSGARGGRDGEEGREEPMEVFEGHTDVVKEFVWRKGGDDTAFQLITWSKDRMLLSKGRRCRWAFFPRYI
ncbi:hypothetical protein C8J57DRAFT_1537520 [Mycena rebaudengoi]|nr:hypothetical protein C8J57DRAFT_1537520 [Mycena rebaudengoi]